MIKLNEQLLVDVGLSSLSTQDKSSLLRHVYDTLQTRVGRQIADHLTGPELDEFEALNAAGDEQQAWSWLQTHFPDVNDIVTGHFDQIRRELEAHAWKVIALAAASDSAPEI